MTVRVKHILTSGLVSLAAASVSQGAVWYWDVSADPGIQEGGGTWNTSSTFWTNDGGATRTAWHNTNNKFDTAVFGHADGTGNAGSVIGTNNLQVGSLQFNKNYTLSNWNVTLNVGTVDVASGVTATISLGVKGDVGLTKTGGGTLVLDTLNTTSYTGGTYVNAGTLRFSSNTSGNLVKSESGPIHLLDTTGSADVVLSMESNNSQWIIPNDIVVRSGSSGSATIRYSKSSGSGQGTLSGQLTLNNDLTLSKTANSAVAVELSGDISGVGSLIIDHSNGSGGAITLSGNNSNHTGSTTFVGKSVATTPVFLNGTQGNSKLTFDKVAASGTGTLRFNIVGDLADLIQLKNGATLDLSGLSLQPMLSGVQTLGEYKLIDTTTGVSGQFAAIIGSPQYAFLVDYDGTDANPNSVVLILTPIPEPAAMSLLAIGALPLLLRRRKA